jgi:hypothetical protein
MLRGVASRLDLGERFPLRRLKTVGVLVALGGIGSFLETSCVGTFSTRSDAGVGPDAGGSRDAGASPDAGSVSVTFNPTPIASSASELSNPLRGQYLWLGTPAYPTGWPDLDSYSRWNWAQIEPAHLQYQWSLIDDQITAAKARGGRFGMRIMALCQGCGDHTYMGAQTSIPDDLAAVVNPLIGTAPGDTVAYVIPDWNSDTYFSRLQELLTAIATRYQNEPHFAWMDVSSYGNWGEMHLYPFSQSGGPYDTSTQTPITDANAARLVTLNATTFSNKLLVVNSEQTAALTAAVASTSPPIGLRVDCLGSDGLAGGDGALMAVPGAIDRWKTAPFITEWCQVNLGTSGMDLFVQGEAQVRQYHVSMLSSDNFATNPQTTAEVNAFRTANVESGYRLRTASVTLSFSAADRSTLGVNASWVNDNVAPTYLVWNASIGLKGTTTIEGPLTVDLRQVLPGTPLTDNETVKLAAPLAAGIYNVYLRVDDAQQVSVPMQLGMAGRDSTGAYALGQVTVP